MRVVQDSELALVEVRGDLDMAEIQELALIIDGICLEPPRRVVLDVERLDSGCYPPLILVALAAVDLWDSGTDLCIRGPEPMVEHIYHLAGGRT